ncbi:26557_t:CDS:2, partial [Gigaspora margarita]
ESSISKTLAKVKIKGESSDQIYNPSSDFEYSIKVKAKRSYYLDYFIGPSKIVWKLKEDFIIWAISSEDISKICIKYHNNIIQKCISKEILNNDEELYILFVVDNKKKQYLKSCLNPQLIAKIETRLTRFIKEDNSFVYNSENQETDSLNFIYKDMKPYTK